MIWVFNSSRSVFSLKKINLVYQTPTSSSNRTCRPCFRVFCWDRWWGEQEMRWGSSPGWTLLLLLPVIKNNKNIYIYIVYLSSWWYFRWDTVTIAACNNVLTYRLFIKSVIIYILFIKLVGKVFYRNYYRLLRNNQSRY